MQLFTYQFINFLIPPTGCELDFDYNLRTINFNWAKEVAETAGSCNINSITEEFSNAITNNSSNTETDGLNLYKYSDCSNYLWSFYTCDWFININKSKILEICSLDEWQNFVKEWNKPRAFFKAIGQDAIDELLQCNPYDKIIHYRNCFFIVEYGDFSHESTFETQGGSKIHLVWYNTKLVMIASFSPWLNEQQLDNAKEINIIPAIIDETEKGKCVFIECGELEEMYNEYDKSYLQRLSESIRNGESDKQTEYIDKIYVAFYEGKTNGGINVCPRIEDVEIIQQDWSLSSDYSERFNASLRLNTFRNYSETVPFDKIDMMQKYTFKFLSKEIPNIRSVFYINGKRYVAIRITATISENGMSEMLKGEFYKIID